MRTRTIIETDTFKQMIAYNPVVTENDARNKVKMTMLNSVINAIGIDKWHRMKPDTRHAIEYLTFLAVERGFAWCSPEHVAGRYSVNSFTVRRYIAQLASQGIVSRLWRSSTHHNGRGCMVVFFSAHPYYDKYWRERFFMSTEAKAEIKAEIKAENDENLQSINENSNNFNATLELPDSKSKELKERSNEYYLEYLPDYIPHSFAKLYGCYFSLTDNKVAEYWRMARLAAWKYLQEDCDNIADIAEHAFRQLIGQMKITGKHVKNPVSYFYGTCKNLFHRQFIADIEEKYLETEGQ
ncbi:MAG: hypothetical protein ACE3JK_01555 [Sporolactobacillus sp.]